MFTVPRVVDLFTKKVIVVSKQVMFSSKEGYQHVPYDNVTIECESRNMKDSFGQGPCPVDGDDDCP